MGYIKVFFARQRRQRQSSNTNSLFFKTDVAIFMSNFNIGDDDDNNNYTHLLLVHIRAGELFFDMSR